MIEQFAPSSGSVPSGFLDLNHTSKSMILVSLMSSLGDLAANTGELRNRDTRGKCTSGSQSRCCCMPR